MVLEFLKAFVLIFFAEMGDKSQLLAITFAAKYKIRNVIIGIAIGIFLNHLIAVLLGAYITSMIMIKQLTLIAGILFILFGLFSLRITGEVEESKKMSIGPIFTVALALFIGELGDKTQLTAIILASESSVPVLILFGTVSAMILTSLLGIYIGMKFGAKIPEFILKVLSSVVFIFFGTLKIISSVTFSSNELYFVIGSIVLIGVYSVLLFRFKH